MSTPRVGILMGSLSDKDVMMGAVEVLNDFGIEWEMKVRSAHRTPEQTLDYARSAQDRGVQVLIAGAGMAAHLAGVLAAESLLPVIGVPIAASLGGFDSLLATVQMPPGIPVATVAVGKAGAKNAAWMAVRIMSLSDEELATKLVEARKAMVEKILEADAILAQDQ
ncbi:MAG: 5-(carboxyamino)imidazole ribonucleotide mutase [Myxococcota bacterium]|nr:5-(carboxyamino)imidazole ribonucleotide mutase [Myxococcota bacterium]